MPKATKRIKALEGKHDQDRTYALAEATQAIKECATTKFDESVDLAFHLGVDPRHADQMVRGSVALPHGTGKDVRVVVLCKSDAQVQEAKDAGALEVGADDIVEKIQGGWTDFDSLIAAPDMMALVGKLGKVLGPRGLMPSPKAGTVTPQVGNAVTDIKKGKIDYRVDKFANIHVPVGKASFSADQIRENAASVIESVIKGRPASCKGTYMKSCSISSTMGPGFKVDTSSI
jgi:large subunit ribosomal protein L1